MVYCSLSSCFNGERTTGDEIRILDEMSLMAGSTSDEPAMSDISSNIPISSPVVLSPLKHEDKKQYTIRIIVIGRYRERLVSFLKGRHGSGTVFTTFI
jgi:hypothetical protein